MECLTEFTCSVFADGELPEVEQRQVEKHLESCSSCRAMAAAYREENRLFIHCIQEIDLTESGAAVQSPAGMVSRPPAPAARPKDIVKFGGLLVGLSVLVRLAMSSPENFVLPASPVSLDWLDPSNLSGKLNWLAGAIVFVAAEGVSRMLSLVEGLSVGMLYALILGVVVILVRRSFGTRAITATLATLGTILLFVASTPSSYAMDVRNAGSNRDQVTVVPEGTIIDDSLFATGDSVIIDGTITGDLIAFARQVTVHGTVNGNIITAAQTIDIQGTVGGSIIAAGSSIEVNSKVAHNLLAFGQRIALGKDGSVAGDFGEFGSETHMNGMLAHNLYAFAASSDIAGSVGRSVEFRGGTISILPTAHIGGDLTSHVQRPEAVHVDSGSVIDGKQSVILEKPQAGPNKYTTFGFYFSQALHVAAAFIAGMILLLLFPGMRRVSFSGIGSTLVSGGIGFLALVAMPIAAFIVAITLIGLPVGIVGFMAWLLGLYLAKIIVATFVGRTILSADNDRLPAMALNLFVGLLLIFFVINLPYVGGLIHFLLVLIGFGGLVMSVYNAYQAEHGSGRLST